MEICYTIDSFNIIFSIGFKGVAMAGLHLIWNPIAGNGAAVRVYAQVAGYLDSKGISFYESKSAYSGQITELTRAALENGAERIIVLGGDGTVREAAIALNGSDVPMAIVPCGTGNDLRRPLGLPLDPIAALKVALNGVPKKMDAAMANGELFFNVAGFGFDVDVLDYTEIYKKKYRNGSLAYLHGLLRAITGRKNRWATITWPQGQMEKNVLLIAAGNGSHFGGGMMVAPGADPFDGLLDICVVHDVNLFAILTMLPKFITGKHIHVKKYVTYFRTTKLAVTCDPASRIEVDGDVMPGTPVTFEILPQSLWVMTPGDSPSLR